MEEEIKNNIVRRSRFSAASRVLCGTIFLGAAGLVLASVFGVIDLGVNVGILAALTALAIVVIYSAFRMFWGGVFFVAAAMIAIMNANDLIFSLDGAAIGGIFIAAGLLTVAFHIFFKKSSLSISIGGVGDESSTTFGSNIKYFEDEISAERLECNFGSIKAYFENAKPKNGEATINVECNFGSIELYVPKGWRVAKKVEKAFGDIKENGNAKFTEKSPILNVVGEVNFGSINIIYV